MKKIQSYFSQIAQKTEPYQWEEVLLDNSLRFDTNTLPYPPENLPKFFESMAKNCPINEYADPTYRDLKKLIVKYLQERDGNKGKHFNFSEHHILPIEDVIALESIGTLY